MRGPQLTQRDVEVLRSLSEYRFLSVTQILELHFSSRQTAYRRLRALTELRFVKHFNVPGIDERLYQLTPRGHHELEAYFGDEFPSPPERQPKDYYFLRHHAELSSFQIALTEACTASDVLLLGFLPEHRAERVATGRGGFRRHIRDVVDTLERGRISHTPDAVFSLLRGNRAALFFLEIDRGTTVLSDPTRGFLKAARFYLHYAMADGHRRYEEEFSSPNDFDKGFRSLVVTTGERRLESMRRAVTDLAFPEAGYKRYLWGSTTERVSTQGVFAPVWRSLDAEDPQWYGIAGNHEASARG